MPAVEGSSCPPRRSGAGLVYGFLSVILWALYNIGSEMSLADGFRRVDLIFLRFCVGGLCLLPVLLLSRRALPPWRRLLVLCVMVGPLFGFLVATGFQNVPLAHAVIVPPTTSIIVASLLVRLVSKERLSRRRLLGIGLLILGLCALAFETPTAEVPGRQILLGDLSFVASGTLWGGYTFLMARWRLPAAPTAAAIGVSCGLIVAPVYLALFGITDLPPALWMEQALYQGLIGGALSFVAFAATVSRLGAGRAALFFALVPSTAIVMAVPLTGQVPTPAQVVSIVLASAGITVALEVRPRLRRRHDG